MQIENRYCCIFDAIIKLSTTNIVRQNANKLCSQRWNCKAWIMKGYSQAVKNEGTHEEDNLKS